MDIRVFIPLYFRNFIVSKPNLGTVLVLYIHYSVKLVNVQVYHLVENILAIIIDTRMCIVVYLPTDFILSIVKSSKK